MFRRPHVLVHLYLLLLISSGVFAALPSAEVEHPAVAHMHMDRRLKQDPKSADELIAAVMAMSEEHLLSLIEDKHGFLGHMPCPRCDGRKLDFSWKAPHLVRCRECGAEISERTFPPTHSVVGPNGLGEPVTYRYYKKGYTKHFVAGYTRARRHYLLAAAARALGAKYHETKDERLARRAALVLDRFATVYRRWPIVETTRPRSYRFEYKLGPKRPYGHWGFARWQERFMYEIPQDCVFAYDFVYDSGEWAKLSQVRGYDARAHVERDFFTPARSLALAALADMGGKIGNLNPSLYQRMIHLGRVVNDPDLVHAAVKHMDDMVRMSYHFDGMEYEGTVTYHGVVTGRLGIAERMLRGYSDPPGYVDERFGIRLEKAQFAGQYPVFGKAWRNWGKMRFPNGNTVCIHDTGWPPGRRETPDDAEADNVELNAYGHYAIGRGKGPDAMQAHLHFCPRAWGGHFHIDRLSLILWSAGEELLSDIGYVNVGRKHRYFVNRAICHNTVEVLFDDPPKRPETVQPKGLPADPVAWFKVHAAAERPAVDARSSILAYDPGPTSGKRVQLIEASSPGPPWMGIAKRSRAILMIAADENRSYLVDLFRVAGGNTHQFVLRPSVDEDVTSECSLDLQPRKGTLAGEDVPYGKSRKGVAPYSWLVHDLKTRVTPEPWRLTWAGQDSGASIRCHFRGQANTEVILAQSPTLRRGQQDSRVADKFQGPHLMVRRRGQQGLESLYAAVYDCWRRGANPVVANAEWHPADGALALTVRLDDRTDIVYASEDDRVREVAGARFTGRFAVLSLMKGEPMWGWAYGGASVAMGTLQLECPVTVSLPLAGVRRKRAGDPMDGFVVHGPISDAAELTDQWLRAIMGDGKAYAYRIEEIARQGDQTLITIHDEPGFELTSTGSRLLFNPFYDTDGLCRVEIARSVFRARRPPASSKTGGAHR